MLFGDAETFTSAFRYTRIPRLPILPQYCQYYGGYPIAQWYLEKHFLMKKLAYGRMHAATKSSDQSVSLFRSPRTLSCKNVLCVVNWT